MSKDPQTHYLVEFAARYAGARFKTLNAASALWRAESLLDDVEMLLELKTQIEQKDLYFGSRAGTYEIVGYYFVGLCTCLEWHARSRLVDLMLYRPACIEASDLKNIATVALSQMVAEGATIPHLLGAATHISQWHEYLRVFERVFSALNMRIDIEKELRAMETNVEAHRIGEDTSLFSILGNLFENRNHLVHEIDLSVVGHFSLRDMWNLSDAQSYCKAVVVCIKWIESQLTTNAPEDFPNRLHPDGYEEDEFEKLIRRVGQLEAEISKKITELSDSPEMWTKALQAAQESRKLELEYLEEAEFLRPIRHLDMRRNVQIELLKNRVAFLFILKSELEW